MLVTYTPRKINMEPENTGPLEKEKSSEPNHHFEVRFLNLRGCILVVSLCTHDTWPPWFVLIRRGFLVLPFPQTFPSPNSKPKPLENSSGFDDESLAFWGKRAGVFLVV